jgi:hypothetical protein
MSWINFEGEPQIADHSSIIQLTFPNPRVPGHETVIDSLNPTTETTTTDPYKGT